jgi:hypothetical protein
MNSVSTATIGTVAGEKPFVLRLPEDLKATLARLAKLEDRSLNAQIVRVLREWADQHSQRGEHPKP